MTAAFIFPGQGSQAVGMGKALAEALSRGARRLRRGRRRRSAQKLSALMFEGPRAELTLTANAQPALMAVSLAVVRVLEAEAGLDLASDAAFVAGHSLGEYSALAAAGSLTHRRHGAAAAHPRRRHAGGRAGRRRAPWRRCSASSSKPPPPSPREAAQGEVCEAANDNGGGQVVVSGTRPRSSAPSRSPRQGRAPRAMLLPVSAPFHCALMQPAADAMARGAGAGRRSSAPVVPVVANVHGRAVTDPDAIRDVAGRAGDRHGALARVRGLHGRARASTPSTRSAPARC